MNYCALDAVSARAAPVLKMRVLVVQGVEDPLVKRQRTRAAAAVPCSAQYIEVPGAHDLLDPASPGHVSLLRAVIGFAGSMRLG